MASSILHYCVTPGDVLNERYTVKQELGRGTYGIVVLAHDCKTETNVAVKLSRIDQRYAAVNTDEYKLLSLLNKNKSGGCTHMVRVSDWFMHDKVREAKGGGLFDVQSCVCDDAHYYVCFGSPAFSLACMLRDGVSRSFIAAPVPQVSNVVISPLCACGETIGHHVGRV
jgi:serine/threonine protein kinase